jgi:hypothetical protein
MVVKIPAEIYYLKVEFCENAMLIHNTESDTIGIKTMNKSCMVKVQEGGFNSEFMDLRGFLPDLPSVILYCLDGLYTNCSNGEFFLINALDMGYDEAVQIVAEVGSVGNNGLSIDTSGFSNLLSSKTKNIFLIIGIIVGAVILAIIVIIIVCILCNYCPKRAVVT